MVNYAWIQRIPPTQLTKIYIEAVGAIDEIDLMEGISNQRYHLFPDLALEVIRAAHNGDHAASEVIQWAGEELGWLAVSVARQIEMENDEVEIIQSGSIFEAGELITKPMRDLVLKYCHKLIPSKLPSVPSPPLNIDSLCESYHALSPGSDKTVYAACISLNFSSANST